MVVVAAERAAGWWAMKTLTLDEVRAMFERLEARAVGVGVGEECLLVIQQVASEVLGELGELGAGGVDEEDEEDGPRARALLAKSAAEFDQAAWELLKGGGWYDDISRIEMVRQSVVPAWRPGVRSSAAMLEALVVYRSKREAAREWGEAPTAAHQFAKREAMSAYNRAIRG